MSISVDRLGFRLSAWLVAFAMMSALSLSDTAYASEETLDNSALNSLALSGIWEAQERDMGYWSWNDDQSVCLRIFGPTDDCADKGTWSVSEGVLCYEIGWWGDVYGHRDNCFTVIDLGDGLYDARFHTEIGSRFITFRVLE